MADPSLKILYCAFGVIPDATGLSTRITDFIRGLQNRAVVDGLTIKPPDRAHIERYLGARLMRVPVGTGDINGRIQAFERALQRQVTSDDYAVIHTTDPFSGDLLARLKREHEFKLVYDACGFPSVEFRYTDPHLEGDRAFMLALRKREQASLLAADAVLAPTSVTRDYLVKQGVSADKITVAGPAADLKHFQPAAQARPDRIPMRLLYLGSQASWQGLPTLLFALRDALKQPEAIGMRLSIVGPRHTEWRRELEEQVKGRGIADSVEFLDPVGRDDLPRVLSQYDIGVAALEKSDRNVEQGGLVMKVAEYAAAGRPIVISDLPLARALVDESCARFFPAGRDKELGKAIIELAANPAKRVQMGQAARRLAEERFDADRLADSLFALYERLAATMAPRRSVTADDTSDVPTSVGDLVVSPQADTGKTGLPGHARRTDEIPIPNIGEGVGTSPHIEPTPIVPGLAVVDPGPRTDEIPIVVPPGALAETKPSPPPPSLPVPSQVAKPATPPPPAVAAPIAAPAPVANVTSSVPPPTAPSILVALKAAPSPAPAIAAVPKAVPPPGPAASALSKAVLAPPPSAPRSPVLQPASDPPPTPAIQPPIAAAPPPIQPASALLPPAVNVQPASKPAAAPAAVVAPLSAAGIVAPPKAPVAAAAAVTPPPSAPRPPALPVAPAKPVVVAPPPIPASKAGAPPPLVAPPHLPKSGVALAPSAKVPPLATAGPPPLARPPPPVSPSSSAAVAAPAPTRVPIGPVVSAEPELLEADDFQSLSESVELPPTLLDAADLVLDLPSPAATPPPVSKVIGDGNSVAFGTDPWLHSAILGFSPMGQLHVPDYASMLGPLIAPPDTTKAAP